MKKKKNNSRQVLSHKHSDKLGMRSKKIRKAWDDTQPSVLSKLWCHNFTLDTFEKSWTTMSRS